MSASSVMLSLPQMVDLALNSPEVGVVNFNLLHSLLHVIIQQIDLLECKVEFKGNDSERVQSLIASSKPGPSLNLTEYIVTPGKDQKRVVTKKKLKRMKKKPDDTQEDTEEILVQTEVKVKGSKEGSVSSSISNLLSDSMQTVVVVEPVEASAAHVSVAISQVHFKNLEDDVERIKDDIKELRDLPTNTGLIDALRNSSVDKSSPVVDMFQILSIIKRLEANEAGVNKLASIVEDLAKGPLGDALYATGYQSSGSYSQGQAPPGTQADITTTTKSDSPGKPSISGGASGIMGQNKTTGGKLMSFDASSLEQRIKVLEDELSQILLRKVDDKKDSKTAVSPEERLIELENKFQEWSNQVDAIDAIYSNQVEKLQTQFTDLEKEIGEIIERIQAGGGISGVGENGSTAGGGGENIADVYNKLSMLQEQLDNVSLMVNKLTEQKDENQQTFDEMHEQIELLKTVKADREDLEDMLADKADACAVNRKVSHDQFDAACDDLARGIEDALGKLTQQEQLWQSALDEIQKEIENKLDKMELTPLKDFVTNKLKILQERLKALAALKKETEAAGSKSKFLRNVQCISCDKDVVMRKEMDSSLMPTKPGLPPTKSMAPYLAYELDALRKQQKCMPHARNMNHFESAMSGTKTAHGEDGHLCNRYCGGSHTVTTPQQRVTRLGHFLQQWSPETAPTMETQIRGTDGQLYKARDDKTAARQMKPIQPEPDHLEIQQSPKGKTSITLQNDTGSAQSSITKPQVEQTESKEVEVIPTPDEIVQRVSSGSQAKVSQRTSISVSSAKRESAMSAGRVSPTKRSVSSATKVPSRQSQGSSAKVIENNNNEAGQESSTQDELAETNEPEEAPMAEQVEEEAPAE